VLLLALLQKLQWTVEWTQRSAGLGVAFVGFTTDC